MPRLPLKSGDGRWTPGGYVCFAMCREKKENADPACFSLAYTDAYGVACQGTKWKAGEQTGERLIFLPDKT